MVIKASTSTSAWTRAIAEVLSVPPVVMLTVAFTLTRFKASITMSSAAATKVPAPTVTRARLFTVTAPLAPPALTMDGMLTPLRLPLNRLPRVSDRVCPALPITDMATLT